MLSHTVPEAGVSIARNTGEVVSRSRSGGGGGDNDGVADDDGGGDDGDGGDGGVQPLCSRCRQIHSAALAKSGEKCREMDT